jgi:hypothetical protein
MTRRQPQSEQLKAVPDPLESQRRAARKPERETFAVYRLPDLDDDANAEREFLLTLPVDQDVERRIKKDYGAGSYRVERRRGGRFVSVTEMRFDEPPQQREDAGERESDAPEDFDERVAQAVEDILEARRAERARARALKPNLAPGVSLQQPAAATDPLNDLVRTVSVLKQLGVPIGEVSRAAAEAPKDKDEDDRVLLSLLKDRSLRQRITSSIASMVGNPDAGESSAWYVHMMQALEERPQLTSKLFGLIDRVMPSVKADDAGDDEEGEIDLEESCVTYLLEKCAANESVKLNDEPVRALAVANPQGFKDFIGLIQLASVEQIIEHLSKEFDLARIVLRAPHAHAWFVRLKELAAAATPE